MGDDSERIYCVSVTLLLAVCKLAGVVDYWWQVFMPIVVFMATAPIAFFLVLIVAMAWEKLKERKEGIDEKQKV